MKKIPFLFKTTETTTTSAAAAAAWPWPACVNNPKTLSFRATTNTNIYKTMNSTYLDDDEDKNTIDSFSEENEDESTVVGRLRSSDRLFFEPGETSSILEVAKTHYDFINPYNNNNNKESVAILAMDSTDPVVDFRVSMEEMVEAHGLKDWECLEELLTCYLRVNGKSNHPYIIGAYVDLLFNLSLASASASNDQGCSSSSSTATTQCSFTSPLSFTSSTYSSTSPCLSLMENEDHEIVVEKSCCSSSSS